MNVIIGKIDELKCNVEGCCAQIQQNRGLIVQLEKANEKQTKRIKFE